MENVIQPINSESLFRVRAMIFYKYAERSGVSRNGNDYRSLSFNIRVIDPSTGEPTWHKLAVSSLKESDLETLKEATVGSIIEANLDFNIVTDRTFSRQYVHATDIVIVSNPQPTE